MKRYRTRFGSDVLVEESRAVPVVDLAIVWDVGAMDDPVLGSARMLARLLRRGSRGMDPTAIDEEAALLGGRLGISISRTMIRIQGSVLARNLAPFVALLAKMLREPALRAADLKREKRRVTAELEGLLDDDSALAGRMLRRAVLGGGRDDHPLTQPVGGTLASLRKVQRSHLVELHGEALVGRRLLFGAAGDVDPEVFLALLEETFGTLAKGRKRAVKLPKPELPKGRHVYVVDKDERSQTQLAIGTLGSRVRDPDLAAMVVADTAFGSLFSSRLMQEVRESRGWSYSAYSHLGAGRQRETWAMWTHPSVANAYDCAALEIGLLEDWTAHGLRPEELRFAKEYLIGSRCLDEDTASRRLDLALDSVTLGFPEDRPQGYVQRIGAVDGEAADSAVRKRLKPAHLAIVAVGTASALAPRLEALPGVRDVTVVKPRDLL